MSDVIDLDALSPTPTIVAIGQEQVSIEPPSLEDVMRLGALSQKMGKFDGENLEEASQVVSALTNQIYKCAPGLQGKTLNTAQLMKMVSIITEMAMPEDAKELKAKGITADTDPKAS